MKDLNHVIACVEYCTNEETCDGCPSGLTFEECDIDSDVLEHLKQKLEMEKAADRNRS